MTFFKNIFSNFGQNKNKSILDQNGNTVNRFFPKVEHYRFSTKKKKCLFILRKHVISCSLNLFDDLKSSRETDVNTMAILPGIKFDTSGILIQIRSLDFLHSSLFLPSFNKIQIDRFLN